MMIDQKAGKPSAVKKEIESDTPAYILVLRKDEISDFATAIVNTGDNPTETLSLIARYIYNNGKRFSDSRKIVDNENIADIISSISGNDDITISVAKEIPVMAIASDAIHVLSWARIPNHMIEDSTPQPYRVELVRNYIHKASVDVMADSRDDAEQMALELAGDIDFRPYMPLDDTAVTNVSDISTIPNTVTDDPNSRYNCSINICIEDIINLKCGFDKILHGHKPEPFMDLYPFTIRSLIERWERKIGKTLEECMEDVNGKQPDNN